MSKKINHIEGIGLIEPGTVYVVEDTRTRARKPLPETSLGQKLKFKPYKATAATADETGVYAVKLTDINFDRSKFQNRKRKYSEDSINRIIDAVKKGEFKWEVFDPVLLWLNPSDKKLYVLSGHSRTEAFTRLAKEGVKIGNRGFNTIPAKIIRGSENEAIKIALESNTLSTKESDTERANYYHTLIFDLKQPIETVKDLVWKNEGRDANRIFNMAFLNPDGALVSALELLDKGDVTSKSILQTFASWIGRARRQFPQLTDLHEAEMYYFLKSEGYGSKPGQIKDEITFIKRITGLIEKHTQLGIFEQDKPLNLKSIQQVSTFEKDYNERLVNAEQELSEAKKVFEKKRDALIEAKADEETTGKILKRYNDLIALAQKKVIEIRGKKQDYLQAEKNQQTLFGLLGLDLNYSGRQLNFNGFKPTYTRLKSYDHLIEPSDNKDTLHGYGLAKTEEILKATAKNSYQVRKLAKHLKADTLSQSCFNVWHFVCQNIKYAYDQLGVEQVRTPARSWADRHSGVDCDCMSTFIASCLIEMGYNPEFWIVQTGQNKTFNHIYTVCSGVVCDSVLTSFNEHPKNIVNKKIIMIPVYGLSGVGSETYQYTEPIYGLGAIAMPSHTSHIAMKEQSEIINRFRNGLSYANDGAELRKLRTLIMLNGTPEQKLITPLMPIVKDINEAGHYVFATEELAGIAEEYHNNISNILSGCGNSLHGDSNALIDAEIGKLFSKIKSVAQKVGGAVKTAAQKTGQAVATAAKAVVKVLMRFNPLTIAARNGFRVVVSMNFLGLAAKLAPGLLTEAEATAAGYDLDEWRKTVSTLNKVVGLYEKLGGQKSKLIKSINTGKDKKALLGKNPDKPVTDYSEAEITEALQINPMPADAGESAPDGSELAGLGEVATATAATASSGIIASVMKLLKSIDFKKLIKKGSEIAKENKEVIKQVTEVVKVNLSRKPENDGFTTSEEQSQAEQMLTTSTPLIDANAKSNANNEETNITTETEKPSFLKQYWWVLAGAVVVGGYMMSSKGKNSKKSK